MTRKKDRRSARTRKRDESKVIGFIRAVDMQSVFMPKSPAFPRSHSSSAPMLPEVSQ